MELLCDVHLLCILGVGSLDHRDDCLNHELSIQCGHPLLFDCLRADLTSVSLNIGVVDFSDKVDLWWLKWIPLGKV